MKRRILGIFFGICAFTLLYCFTVNNNVYGTSGHQYDSNFDYTYTTTVDNPVTPETLIEILNLKAYDGSGADITADIVITNPGDYYKKVIYQPTPYNRETGSYFIVYRVYDQYGNHSDCTIKINVVDNVAPVIGEDSVTNYVFNKREINQYTIEAIKRGINVEDNHDHILNYYFEDDFDLTTATGWNQVYLYISDQSGNRIGIMMEIEIIDTTGPQVFATTTYIRNSSIAKAMTYDEIKLACELSAYDYENKSECSFIVDYDDYTENYNVNGLYTVRFLAMDANNNTTSVDVFIEVIERREPVFYLNSTEVNITNKVCFDLAEADRIIKAKKLAIREDYTLSVEKDEYSINKEIEGSYIYQVKASYSDESCSLFEFIINVSNEDASSSENLKTDFPNAIKKGLSIIWKIIKWPIEKVSSFFKNLF